MVSACLILVDNACRRYSRLGTPLPQNSSLPQNSPFMADLYSELVQVAAGKKQNDGRTPQAHFSGTVSASIYDRICWPF